MSNDGSLPRGWVRATMQDVASIVGGGTPSTSNRAFWNDGDIPWITPADLSGYEQKTISRGARNITPLGLERSGAALLPAGTVLFSSRAPIGYVAIASNPMSTNQGFKSFVLEPGIAPDYIYYYLQFAKPLALSLASGTTFQEISGQKARVVPVVVAPVAEQPRIVEAIETHISRLDDAVASLERALAKLKAYRASVLKAAVEGRLVPTEASLARAEKRDYEPAEVLLVRILKERRRRWEESELAKLKAAGKTPKDDKWKSRYQEPAASETTTLPDLPEGWCWATTGRLCDCIVPNRDKPKAFSGDTPWITLPDLGESVEVNSSSSGAGLTEEEITKYKAKVIPENSVIMSCIGRFGVTAVLRRSAVINQQLHAFLPSEGLSPTYLAYAIRSQVQFMNGLATSTTIAYLNKANCNSVPIPLPPMAEQMRIVNELERLDSISWECAHLVQFQVRRAARLRQAILKWAFEGKLVDQDPTDEPAERLLARIRAERAADTPTKKSGGRKAKGAA